jgi:hypothetical protein
VTKILVDNTIVQITAVKNVHAAKSLKLKKLILKVTLNKLSFGKKCNSKIFSMGYHYNDSDRKSFCDTCPFPD